MLAHLTEKGIIRSWAGLPVILEPHSSYSTCRYGKMFLIVLCALELSYSQQCTLCCKLWMENRKGCLNNLDNIYITSCLLCFLVLASLFSSPFPTPPSTRWLTWVPILPSLCRKHQLNIYTSMGPCYPACCTLCPGPTPHHLHNILLSIGNFFKVWNGNYPCDHHLTSKNSIIDICKSWVGSWKNQSD